MSSSSDDSALAEEVVQMQELLELQRRHRNRKEELADQFDELNARREALQAEVAALQGELAARKHAPVAPASAQGQAAVDEGEATALDALGDVVQFNVRKSVISTSRPRPDL